MLKKILSILFGLFLSLLFLEIFLQSVSFTVKYIKDYKTYFKYKTFKTKDSVTILCIGESTTGGQYPIQLQEVLNSVNPGKFTVVDCGIPAITIAGILENFDTNVKKYNPDILLFMTGINESSEPYENYEKNEKNFNIQKIKIYRLTDKTKI
jgi:lysophospholipase L1-like esterase